MRTVWLVLVAVFLAAPLGAQCDPGNGLGGTGPDVMRIHANYAAEFGEAGHFYPINKFPDFEDSGRKGTHLGVSPAKGWKGEKGTHFI